MATFEVLTVFTGIALALFVSVNGQANLDPLTSTTGMATLTVTEGTDFTIPIVCHLDMIDTVDRTCVLEVNGGTTDAEFGYDIPALTSTCTIRAGDLSSTVTLQYIDDANAEPAEAISLICNGGSATTFDITLNDDDDGVTMAQARLTEGSYSFTEGSPATTATLTIEYVDNLGNKVNAEEDLTGTFSFMYPKSGTEDTAVLTTDFTIGATFTAVPVASSLNTDGTAYTGLEVEYIVTDDAFLENLKRHCIQLSGAGTYMDESTDLSKIWIADDDLPAAYALIDLSPLSRRSKQDVNIAVFTKSTNSDFTLTSVPYTPKDCIEKTLPIYNGVIYSFAKPSRRSRTRFNEYVFTTTETIGTPAALPYPLTTSIDISATSHRGSKAPIETSVGQTITVYPSLEDCTDDALSSRVEIAAPYASSFSDQLRWFFYPANDPTREIRRRPYNGKSSFFISKCSEVGIYRLCRRRRCSRGWYDFVRVIQAACPEGTQYPDPVDGTCSDPASFVCTNGGTFDPTTRNCMCPPGFAGVTCEIALTPGQFGSSAEFTINSFFSRNNRGKGIRVCLNDPGGCSCFAGFYGNDCTKECPPGMFGADCTLTCHCNDDHCDPFSGVCENGCAPGFSGTNCQI